MRFIIAEGACSIFLAILACDPALLLIRLSLATTGISCVGIRGFWRSDSLTWPECPSYSLVPPAQPLRTFAIRPRKPPVVKAVLSMFGVPGAVVQWLPEWVLTIGVGREGSPWIGAFPDEVERKGEVPGCAWAWGKESHPYVLSTRKPAAPPSVALN